MDLTIFGLTAAISVSVAYFTLESNNDAERLVIWANALWPCLVVAAVAVAPWELAAKLVITFAAPLAGVAIHRLYRRWLLRRRPAPAVPVMTDYEGDDGPAG